jgi:hypothetical protein
MVLVRSHAERIVVLLGDEVVADHLSLNKDCPRPRPVQLPSTGHNIIAFPEVGGLHHRYERRAA